MIPLSVNNFRFDLRAKMTMFVLLIGVLIFVIVGVWLGLRPVNRIGKVKITENTKISASALNERILKGNEGKDLPAEDASNFFEHKGFIMPPAELTANQPSLRCKNGDIYAIYDGGGYDPTVVYKNGKMVWRRSLIFTSYSPIRRKFTSDDLFVMSYDNWTGKDNNILQKDIMYGDGFEVNNSYGFDNSFAPTSLGLESGKFYFFAEKTKKYYLVQGTKSFELPYELIIDPPCCSPAVFQIVSGVNKVAFYARKDGIWRYVEIDVEQLFR